MRIRGFLLSAMILACSGASAAATMRIANDGGGQIGQYLHTFAQLRSSGERVIIDGNCLSACTLVLGMIPRNRMCATPRARLGFHAAWLPSRHGDPVTSKNGTRTLWKIYPRSVRRWISRHGGLSRRMIYMQGRDLYAFVPSCSRARAIEAHSRTRYRRPTHYQDANAASYR
jgi:hypothetical protein